MRFSSNSFTKMISLFLLDTSTMKPSMKLAADTAGFCFFNWYCVS